MTQGNRRGLIALNVALLGVLGLIVAAQTADGQSDRGQDRARGNYTLVGGKIVGGNANAIYIIDATNQELVALNWQQRGEIKGIGFRDLAQDAKQSRPGRR